MDVQGLPKLKVLLVGKGGREHALAWKLVHSPSVEHVFVLPGNGGTASLPGVTNIDGIAANDYPGLVRLSQDLDIGLVVAGPDDAVVDGIEGFFRGSKFKSQWARMTRRSNTRSTSRHTLLRPIQGSC